MSNPFSFNPLAKAKATAENAARQIAGRRIPNLSVKLPGNVFRNIPIIGTTIKELAMRQVADKLPKEVTFLLGDILRSGTGPVNHIEPTKAQGESEVEHFMSIIRRRNIVRSDRYVVTFSRPRIVSGISTQLETLSLLCNEASLPPKVIQTRQAMFNALPEQRAHMIDFGGDAITFQFYLDGNWEAKRFFDEWMNGIVDPITRQVAFYQDYIADVTITNLDSGNQETMVTKLEQAFPRGVQAIPLSYSNPDIAHLNVTMTFRRWVQEAVFVDTLPVMQIPEIARRPVASIIQNNKISTIAPALLRKPVQSIIPANQITIKPVPSLVNR